MFCFSCSDHSPDILTDLTRWDIYLDSGTVLKDHSFSLKQQSLLPKHYMVETQIHLPKSDLVHHGLFIFKSFSKYSVYLNDSLLYKQPYKSVSNLVETIPFPQHLLAEKKQTLRIYFSGDAFSFGARTYQIQIGLITAIEHYKRNYSKRALLMDGFLALSVLLNLAFFTVLSRKPAYLFLAAIFLAHFIKLYIYNEAMTTPMTGLEYLPLDTLRMYASISGKLFVGLFFVAEFDIPKKIWAYVAVLTAGIIWYVFSIHLYVLFTFFLCIPIYVIYKKQQSSAWFASIGLLGFMWFIYLENEYQLQLGYMIGVFFFSLMMLLTLAFQMYTEAKEKQEIILKSSRLETQLLQKYIQPHFLMNSLLSLQALIRTNGTKASELIDALSDEFHILAEVSSKKLIPLSQEIEICQTHLKIMGFRKKSTYTFTVNGNINHLFIPPSVLHTLVENGITHGYTGVKDGIFTLTITREKESVTYKLFNDSEKTSSENVQAGTGTKYIEARLQESFPDRWSFESFPVENGWENHIKIRAPYV